VELDLGPDVLQRGDVEFLDRMREVDRGQGRIDVDPFMKLEKRAQVEGDRERDEDEEVFGPGPLRA
jgi:hypothetical protein